MGSTVILYKSKDNDWRLIKHKGNVATSLTIEYTCIIDTLVPIKSFGYYKSNVNDFYVEFDNNGIDFNKVSLIKQLSKLKALNIDDDFINRYLKEIENIRNKYDNKY